jgi:hypothetical protein
MAMPLLHENDEEPWQRRRASWSLQHASLKHRGPCWRDHPPQGRVGVDSDGPPRLESSHGSDEEHHRTARNVSRKSQAP